MTVLKWYLLGANKARAMPSLVSCRGLIQIFRPSHMEVPPWDTNILQGLFFNHNVYKEHCCLLMLSTWNASETCSNPPTPNSVKFSTPKYQPLMSNSKPFEKHTIYPHLKEENLQPYSLICTKLIPFETTHTSMALRPPQGVQPPPLRKIWNKPS